MKKALWKDTFREIRHSLGRFLAILFIILIGVAFYVGIRSAGPDMLYTAGHYFEEQNLMDAQVLSTVGLEDKDLKLLNKWVDGTVQPHVTKDVILSSDNQTVRFYSLDDSKDAINKYWVIEGRLPKTPDEIALDDRYLQTKTYKLNDTVKVDPDFVKQETDATDEENQEILLTRGEFKVVGFVRTPLFIERIARGTTTIGSGSLDAFAVVQPEVIDSDRYTDAYLAFKATNGLESYSDSYKDATEKETDALEKKLKTRAKEKQSEITGEIEDEIKKGEKELQDARDQLDEGRRKLADAEAELAEGRKELDDGQAELASQKAEGRQKLDDGWNKWQDGKNQYVAGQQKLQNGQAQLDQGKQEIATQKAQLDQLEAGLKEVEAGKAQLSQAQKELEAKKQELAAGLEKRPQLEQLLAQMEQLGVDELLGFKKADIEQQLAALDAGQAQIDAAQKQLDAKRQELQQAEQQLSAWTPQKIADARSKLAAAEKRLATKEQELAQGWQELAASQAQLNESEAELNRQEALFQEKISAAEAELAQGEREWPEGKAEFDRQKADFATQEKEAEEKIADGEKELDDARKLLKDLPKVQFIVRDRNDFPGYAEYEDNADRINAIADVLPIFFFFVAILVSLTTMTRMVDEEREYIGIMKAMGYRRSEISLKFITYAFIATTIGALGGLAAGYPVFPLMIYNSYNLLYNLPDVILRTYPLYTATALGASYIATVVATMLAVRHSLRQSAAELLRPKAPKEGQRILLERVSFIWERLSFQYKITLRNLFRYKTRMLMTIFGIAGSCGLILTGFGISDSISDIPTLQFEKINQYQLAVPLNEDASAEEIDQLHQFITDDQEFEEYLTVTNEAVTAEKQGMTKQDVTIYAVHEPERMEDFIELHDDKHDKVLPLEKDKVYITSKLAELLDVKAGDSVTVQSIDQEEWTFKISGIVENYFGHYLYMTPETFEKVTQLETKPNLELVKFDKKAQSEKDLGEKLLEQDAVLGVIPLGEAERLFKDAVESLDIITKVLVVSAALLAFTVLYNLTNINVAERIRELSTIKVLGFYDKEVTAYIYRENILLTLMGILAGYGFGFLLHGFVIRTTEIDMMRFSRHISWKSYLFSAALTFLFSSIVMIIVHRKLKNINMADALKGGD